MRSPGGGELSLSACPGVGNRPPNENIIANPRGYAREGAWLQLELNHALTPPKNTSERTREIKLETSLVIATSAIASERDTALIHGLGLVAFSHIVS